MYGFMVKNSEIVARKRISFKNIHSKKIGGKTLFYERTYCGWGEACFYFAYFMMGKFLKDILCRALKFTFSKLFSQMFVIYSILKLGILWSYHLECLQQGLFRQVFSSSKTCLFWKSVVVCWIKLLCIALMEVITVRLRLLLIFLFSFSWF